MAKKSFKLVKASAALAVTAAALTPVMAAEASTSTVELKAEVVLGGKFKEALALNTPKGVEIKWGKYLVTAINKWQTVKGQGSDGKTYIKKLYARNYPLYIFDQDLGEVEAGSELEKPSIRVMYRDGKVYTQAPERYTMSSTYNTKDEGEQKVLISYNHNGNRITSFLTYTVVAGEVEFANVASSVDQDAEVLSVTADVKNLKEGEKVELVVYPGKDTSATPIKETATVKDGKLSVSKKLPTGTHSFQLVSGEVKSEIKEFTVEVPQVKEIEQLNSKQLRVTFNQEVLGESASITNDATDLANYYINSSTPVRPTSAVLSADKKSVVLTFASIEGTDRVLVVEPIATPKKNSNGVTINTLKFSKVYSFADTVKPVVTGTSYANGKIVLSFSEELSSLPTVVRVNGTPVSSGIAFGSDNSKVEVTYTLAPNATASLYVAGATDASTAGNEMSLFNGSVTAPSADAEKPSIKSVEVTGQNTAKVTLSEAITQTTVNATLQKGAVQSSVSLVKDPTDATGKTYTMTVDLNGATAGDGIFAGTSTSETFTLFVAAGAMTDSANNSNELFSTNVTFNKDLTAPAFVGSQVSTDAKKLEFKFNENLVVDGLTSNIVVRDAYGVKVDVVAGETSLATDTKVYAVDIQSGNGAINPGTYTVTIPASYFKDQYGNATAAVTSTFTVGTSTDTTKPTAVVSNATGVNKFEVSYNEEVGQSALNLSNYKLDGAALPAGTDIYFTNATKRVVVIALPANSINIGDQTTGASAILNVSGVADVAGNVINPFNSTVVVKDNTPASITNVQVIGADVFVTFNENVLAGTGIDANNAFEIKVNNQVVEAGNISPVTGNAKQVKFTLATAATPTVTVKANQAVLTDANGVAVK